MLRLYLRRRILGILLVISSLKSWINFYLLVWLGVPVMELPMCVHFCSWKQEIIQKFLIPKIQASFHLGRCVMAGEISLDTIISGQRVSTDFSGYFREDEFWVFTTKTKLENGAKRESGLGTWKINGKLGSHRSTMTIQPISSNVNFLTNFFTCFT